MILFSLLAISRKYHSAFPGGSVRCLFLLFGSWNIYQAKGSFFCTWCYKVEHCTLRLAISQRELLCQRWDRGDMKEDFCFSSRNTLLNKGVFSESKTKPEQSARRTLLLCSWSASESPACHRCHPALRGEINILCLQLRARCICRVPSNSSQSEFLPAGTALRKLNYVGTHQLRNVLWLQENIVSIKEQHETRLFSLEQHSLKSKKEIAKHQCDWTFVSPGAENNVQKIFCTGKHFAEYIIFWMEMLQGGASLLRLDLISMEALQTSSY